MTNIKEIIPVYRQAKQDKILNSNRKFKVKWTFEMEQDIRAFHSVDAEKELTKTIVEHMRSGLK